MQRLKNYGLWIAIVALIMDILIFSGVMDISHKQEVESLVQRFLEILIIAGILNNPSKGKGYKDGASWQNLKK